jgi:hypothetical protein
MAISDTQKVDYLWKKIGYAATKTDTTANKEGYNEAIPSPLQIRGDKVMTDSGLIPGTIPGANTSIVSVYTTSLPIECTNDATASTNRTWKTNVTDWISPEFGSTYQVKVYVNLSNSAGNAASAGTQLFASGSGNNDEWFFDYQSGVLNFIGANLPSGVNFTGKSVYVSGAEYIGAFGVAAAGSSGSVGNLTISNVTISANSAAVSSSANIILAASGSGAFQFTGNAVGLPSGTTAQRPTTVSAGYIRFNTDTDVLEVYDGTNWDSTTATITSQVLNGNGIANTFTLSSTVGSAADIIVSVNGTLQQPTTAYGVNGTLIIFTETPVAGDVIEVRRIAGGAVSIDSLALGSSNITIPSAGGAINITTNGNQALQIGTTGAIISTYPNTVIASSGLATNVDVFSSSVYRTAKYIFQANTSSTYESSEVLVTHDGSTAYRTVYAVISTGASLGNVTATINGTNVLVQYTAANNNTNIRTLKHYVVI